MYVQKVDQQDSCCLVLFKVILGIICVAVFVVDAIVCLDLAPWGDLTKDVYHKLPSVSNISNVEFDVTVPFEALPVASYKGKFFSYPQVRPRFLQANSHYVNESKVSNSNITMYFYNAQQYDNFLKVQLNEQKDQTSTNVKYVKYCNHKSAGTTTGLCSCLNNTVLQLPEGINARKACFLKAEGLHQTRTTEMEYGSIIVGVGAAINLVCLTILIVIWILAHSKFNNNRNKIKKTKAEGMMQSETYNYD